MGTSSKSCTTMRPYGFRSTDISKNTCTVSEQQTLSNAPAAVWISGAIYYNTTLSSQIDAPNQPHSPSQNIIYKYPAGFVPYSCKVINQATNALQTPTITYRQCHTKRKHYAIWISHFENWMFSLHLLHEHSSVPHLPSLPQLSSPRGLKQASYSACPHNLFPTPLLLVMHWMQWLWMHLICMVRSLLGISAQPIWMLYHKG